MDLRNFECQICKRCYKRKGHYISHVEGHLGIKNYKCIKCGKGFARYYVARCHEENCRPIATPVIDCFSNDGESDINARVVSDGAQMDAKDTDSFPYL